MELCQAVPCTLCGTEKGRVSQTSGERIRTEQGWCWGCNRRGGKPREILPCIDCGDPAGSVKTTKNYSYVIRVKGRCGNCSKAHYRNPSRVPRRRASKKGVKPLMHLRTPVSSETSRIAWYLGESLSNAEKPPEMSDQEKRVQSMRWVQEYRKFRKGWAAIKVKCAEQIKLQTEKLYEDADG